MKIPTVSICAQGGAQEVRQCIHEIACVVRIWCKIVGLDCGEELAPFNVSKLILEIPDLRILPKPESERIHAVKVEVVGIAAIERSVSDVVVRNIKQHVRLRVVGVVEKGKCLRQCSTCTVGGVNTVSE